MVSTLTALRIEVRDLLAAAGIKATEFLPEVLQPPVAVVIPGEPYVAPGKTFGSHDVAVAIYLVGAKGTNKVAAAAMDDLIEKAVEALPNWDVRDIRQPYTITINGSRYLGTEITLSIPIKFN